MNSKVKKCKKCGGLDWDGLSLIEGGRCLSCRIKTDDIGSFNMLKEAPLRLKLLLGGTSLLFLALSIYAISHQYLVLPGGPRGRDWRVEFLGLRAIVPALSLIFFSVSFLSLIVSNHIRNPNEKVFRIIIKNFFYAGWVFYFISIFFFGKEYRS
ncbi:hypothetical protein [Pseudomonas vancouverensis]|uniref:Uncharacterized protein n=1 Tax=Pseudomonas vancouverensis TaxID=95300 RepID=A0A4R4JRK3_PSEVA|nr:hypothetical protein [Pseudomonas vancouverensis]KAB0493895.1 hypothetical protein F7R09_22925 [Pseudomonas vancouverensis]TDB57200.1 hypothetical protein EIY72_26635 [Pseudomonas vancouverensis]